MTVPEAKAAKAKLEAEIEDLIQVYEYNTKTKVVGIELDREEPDNDRIVYVTVKANI